MTHRPRFTQPPTTSFARLRHICKVSIALAISVAALATFAQGPEPVGEQFQANTYTLDEQANAAVGADAQGNFVVVWSSYGSNNSDTDGYSVQGKRYSSDGTPLGPEFQINSYTTNTQYLPRIAMDASGSFVVVWASLFAPNDYAYSVQGRRFSSTGTPLGPEFQINTYTFGFQYRADIAKRANGDFVVVWESIGPADSNGFIVHGQRFSSDGTPNGNEFLVNTYLTGYQRHARVAIDGSGDFVVVWASQGSSDGDNDSYSVQGRRFASNGSPLGQQFQINTYTTGLQTNPQVAVDPANRFMVIWQQEGSSTSNPGSIRGRLFDSDGTPAGSQFTVESELVGSQFRPAISVDNSGTFLLTWNRRVDSGGEGAIAYSIQGQRYRIDSGALGRQFQVNSFTTGFMYRPTVTADGAGQFIVAWTSAYSPGNDSFQSVQGQRFCVQCDLFADGFESGSTSAWSSTTPGPLAPSNIE